MKPLRLVLMAGALAAAAACAPRRDPLPQPQPEPRQPVLQPQQPLPPPPPAPDSWRDLPLTPGSWAYSNAGATSQASFGFAGSPPSFVLRCDVATRRVTLSRGGATSGNVMTVRTTSTSRTLPTTMQTDPLAQVSATLSANDRLLDAIAFSRGRFTVELAGTPMLVLPAWPEPARVVEDCRG